MFLKTSRYAKTGNVETTDSHGRSVQAVKLRRLPKTSGESVNVINGSQLDVMSHQQYGDGSKFWHIADANSELEANALVQKSGRVIKEPQS